MTVILPQRRAGCCFVSVASVATSRRRGAPHNSQVCRVSACHHEHSGPSQNKQLSRRVLLSILIGSAVGMATFEGQAAQLEISGQDSYDAIRTRRHVGIGRFPPDRPAPEFDSRKKLFQIDAGLEAQDVKVGQGDVSVQSGSLVVARWAMVLEDGTTVDASNERQAAIFRPGAHQVPPGIEDSVIGMRPGGKRLVKGTSERILT